MGEERPGAKKIVVLGAVGPLVQAVALLVLS